MLFFQYPVDNFGTVPVVGENLTPYGILALWTVNGLSIVYWVTRHQILSNFRAFGAEYSLLHHIKFSCASGVNINYHLTVLLSFSCYASKQSGFL